MQGASAYQTSKFALLRFTEFLQSDHGKEGLLAFAVHPGGVVTELALNMPKEVHAMLTDEPELAADAIVYLTQEKREWLGGRYVSCTWDMPEFLGMEKEVVEGNKLVMRMVV
jgi:NAD(P)-dependent dehydrogenase (short-subunit alcohol dehydrogenase family)